MDFSWDDFRTIVDTWVADAVRFLPTVLLILVVLLVTLFVSRRVQSLVNRLLGRTQAPVELGILFGRIARIAILVIGAIVILQFLGLGNVALSFITGLGITGIVIGFALQDIVKQFAAGMLLLILRPFHVGNYIQVNGFEGTVVEIQLRATVLKTLDSNEVLIPNADVYNNVVVNKSRYNVRRRTLKLQVPRTADLDAARQAVLQAVEKVPGITKNPTPVLVGTGLDEQNILLELRVWIDTHTENADESLTEAIVAARGALNTQFEVKQSEGGEVSEH